MLDLLTPLDPPPAPASPAPGTVRGVVPAALLAALESAEVWAGEKRGWCPFGAQVSADFPSIILQCQGRLMVSLVFEVRT